MTAVQVITLGRIHTVAAAEELRGPLLHPALCRTERDSPQAMITCCSCKDRKDIGLESLLPRPSGAARP